MAERADWYAKDKPRPKGEGKEGESAAPETIQERHARERMEAATRHASAREALTGQHEEELSALAERHGAEALLPGPTEAAAAGVAPAAVAKA